MRPYASPEEAAFRSEARTWLSEHARPHDGPPVIPSAIVAEWTPQEEEARLNEARTWQATKFDAGWAGISWPPEFGGRGGSLIQEQIFAQEEAAFDVPRDALVVGTGWCGPAMMVHGNTDQKARFLKPLLRGDEVWCQLFSEPGAGSDLAALRTRAERDGEQWVLTGQKTWTTFAHQSHWGLCVARHDATVPKHRGMTAFVVDMGAAGVECRPVMQMTESANFNEVFLDGVRVPDSHRVGEVGDGWRLVITTFMFERMSASLVSGSAVHALLGLLEGRGATSLIKDRFASLYARSQALRYTSLRLLTDISRGRQPGPEGSILKLEGTRLLSDTYELALEVLGDGGALAGEAAPWSGEWGAGFLGAPGLRIGGGTDQIQRNIIGERVLGLPGDIRVDKDVPFDEVRRS
jgi:alkylation response protein AidB-like acyl-CoA dehydrogenase